MKLFIALLLAHFSVLSASFAEEEKSYPLKSELKIIKEGYYPFFGTGFFGFYSDLNMFQSGKVYDVELTIKNTSDKTAYLWTMTCSWEASLIFSNGYIQIIGKACAGNFPAPREIKPGRSEVFRTTLALVSDLSYTYISLIAKNEIINTRLGFIVVSDIFNSKDSFLLGVNLYEYAQEKKNQKAIIWSNPVNLY